MQNEGQNSIYRVLDGLIPKNVLAKKNMLKAWKYGYSENYDMVVISKTGQIGQVIEISGLRVAIPPAPLECLQRHEKASEQYWQRTDLPKTLERIQSIFQWNEMPSEFKDRWVDYIEKEFDYRENGFWFMNNGSPTYITGSHYMPGRV